MKERYQEATDITNISDDKNIFMNAQPENTLDNDETVYSNAKEDNVTKESNIVKYFKYKSSITKFIFLFILLTLLILFTIGLGYFTYFSYVWLWNWATNPISIKIIATIIASFFIWILPLFPIIFMSDMISGIFNLVVLDTENEFQENLAKIEKEQQKFDEELYAVDSEKLLPLISHSRIELEQYYQIGLSQTKKSYTYSIVSMWLGLIILFLGMLMYIFPNEVLNNEIKNGNLQPLILVSGMVLEIISALFLAVYKTSLKKLTYFYDRQIFIHNALFAFKISKTMDDKDESKRLIVEKILDFGSKNNHEK